jgi:hypothetical protein
MSRANLSIAAIRGNRNHKPSTHWQRQASIRERGEQYLRIDHSTLEPWRAGAAVLGVPLSEYVERVLVELGRPQDAACYLEHAITDRLYLTRAAAQEAAERWELWSVHLRLQGHDLPVLVADVIHRGHGRWGIAVDLLGPAGWLAERERDADDQAGEEWKEAQP